MNIYSILDDSDNEEEQQKVKKAKEAKAAKGAEKETQAKPAAKPVAKPDAKAKEAATTAKPAGKVPAESKAKAAPVAAADGEAVVGKDDNRGGRARGKDKAGRGGRGGRGAEGEEGARRPKHDFERRSGTGRGRELSRGGRGAFGFGNVAQDALEAEKDPASANAAIDAVEGEAEAEEVQPPAEPVPVTFTLDEYLQKRNESRAKVEAIGAPKQIRTVSGSEFAGLTTKKEEETVYMGGKKDDNKASSGKGQRSTEKQEILDVAFKFEATQPFDGDREQRSGRGSGRGDRADRGRGGRGGRGERRPDGRGPRPTSQGKPTSVFSALDFPAL